MGMTGRVSRIRGVLRRAVLGTLVLVAGGVLVAAVGAPVALGSATLNWATGVLAPLPADAQTNPAVELHALDCAAADGCSAVGRYTTNGGNRVGLLLTEANGTWTPVTATLPAGADTDPIAALATLSCPSAGNCSAVGSYRDTSGNTQGVLLAETSGTWAVGIQPSVPGANSTRASR
jgi:hypothetical protein